MKVWLLTVVLWATKTPHVEAWALKWKTYHARLSKTQTHTPHTHSGRPHIVTMDEPSTPQGDTDRKRNIGLFEINRNTPEARANQRAWAKREMESALPNATLDGIPVQDRDDMVEQYIVSERQKFDREITREVAEFEVDAWLLKQATLRPSQMNRGDAIAAVAVFFGAFALQLWYNRPKEKPVPTE
jgi:hypothetical protein